MVKPFKVKYQDVAEDFFSATDTIIQDIESGYGRGVDIDALGRAYMEREKDISTEAEQTVFVLQTLYENVVSGINSAIGKLDIYNRTNATELGDDAIRFVQSVIKDLNVDSSHIAEGFNRFNDRLITMLETAIKSIEEANVDEAISLLEKVNLTIHQRMTKLLIFEKTEYISQFEKDL
jgi:hypothetical protein